MAGFRQAIEVAVAVVRDANGRLLMAERPAGKRGAGYWEFPGGKVEPGETAATAAARELHEELGLRAEALVPLRAYTHEFPSARIRLHPFLVTRWQDTPHGREGQRFAWVDQARPDTMGLVLASHARLLTVMALPRRLVRVDAAGPLTPGRVQAALRHGFRGFLLDAARLPPGQQGLLARRMAGLLPPRAMLMLRGSPQAAAQAGVAACVAPLSESPAPGGQAGLPLFGAVCADAATIETAVTAGVDFIVLDGDRGTKVHRIPGIAMRCYCPCAEAAAGQGDVIVDLDRLLAGTHPTGKEAA